MADQLLGGIVINEILVDPNSSGGANYDTDGNGTAHATDEFVELYNASSTAIDISGLQLWDAGGGIGNWFTFPPGTILQPGGHAMVMSGVQSGGSLPTGGPDDIFFEAGRGSALINNGGDNVTLLDPANNEFIQATFNGDALDDPTAGAGGYSGFPPGATRIGSGEDFGNDTDGESLQRTSDGTDVFTSDDPTAGTTNVCFVKGTMIATPFGKKSVEHIQAGDVVETDAKQSRKVIWVHAFTWNVAELSENRKRAPVRISAGALGNGLPLRDLLVSRQHRMMVSGPIAQRMTGQPEVLVAAHQLLVLPGVTMMPTKTPVTYFHILLEGHHILTANGARAESLFLGCEALNSIPLSGLKSLQATFGLSPSMLQNMRVKPARLFVEGKRAKRLIKRYRKNHKPLDGNVHAAALFAKSA